MLQTAINLAFGLYSVGITLVVWLVLVPLELLGVAIGRSSIVHLKARLLGSVPPRRTGRKRIVVHAVSAGEMVAARALVEALVEEWPDLSVLLTTGTQAGLLAGEASRSILPCIEQCTWLPWDRLGALRRWLNGLGPDGVVVIETEIWPNLYRACQLESVPLFIASGRIYPRDVARYAAASWFFRSVLAPVQWVGVQTRADREAFERIGVPPERVQVLGDLKYDGPLMRISWPTSLGRDFKAADAVVIAGSTHQPEERWLVGAFEQLKSAFPHLKLVLAPRRIDRARAIYRYAQGRSHKAVLWSQLDEPDTPEWDVLIVDRFGVLSALYEAADLVVMGGTFVSAGGHNLFEPAAHGRAILAGPHCHHFKEAASELERAGGLLRVDGGAHTEDSIYEACRSLLTNPSRLEQMGARALSVIQARRGSARKYAATISGAITPPIRVGVGSARHSDGDISRG